MRILVRTSTSYDELRNDERPLVIVDRSPNDGLALADVLLPAPLLKLCVGCLADILAFKPAYWLKPSRICVPRSRAGLLVVVSAISSVT